MNFPEAYKTLEIPETSSKEEAKKAFKNLAKQWHPDVNKDPNAEARFKKINEAYQVIESGKSTDPQANQGNWSAYPGVVDLGEIFSNFTGNFNNRSGSFRRSQPSDCFVQADIVFKEAVEGCKKDIKYFRDIKCGKCQGEGYRPLASSCDQCKGKGRITKKQGFTIITQTCPKCRGRVANEPCDECDSTGTLNTEINLSVNVPAGIKNGQVLKLNGVGNYVGGSIFGDQYTSTFLTVNFENDPDLIMEGNDLISKISIPLLFALEGGKQQVKTIDGNQEIEIPPLTKNRDEIRIKGLGIGRQGDQRVVVGVEYPDQIQEIIEILKTEN